MDANAAISPPLITDSRAQQFREMSKATAAYQMRSLVCGNLHKGTCLRRCAGRLRTPQAPQHSVTCFSIPSPQGSELHPHNNALPKQSQNHQDIFGNAPNLRKDVQKATQTKRTGDRHVPDRFAGLLRYTYRTKRWSEQTRYSVRQYHEDKSGD
jgi:hypothetical protein